MEEILIADIEKATKIAASVVKNYGEKYWPLFARLERELEERKSRSNRLAKYE